LIFDKPTQIEQAAAPAFQACHIFSPLLGVGADCEFAAGNIRALLGVYHVAAFGRQQSWQVDTLFAATD